MLALGRVFLAPPPSHCCLPLLAVLLVDCHELLSLGCRFSGVCSWVRSEAWNWLLVSVRRGFVWGANLAGSTCTAAVLVVAEAVIAKDTAASVVFVFSLFWSQLLVGPLLFVCVFCFWASVLLQQLAKIFQIQSVRSRAAGFSARGVTASTKSTSITETLHGLPDSILELLKVILHMIALHPYIFINVIRNLHKHIIPES
ncbi:pentatricopeptide repeat-containing protein [Pyrus ussuriensis x Pyrus communis]|uniref:Pentatricopeptide repeat-containing protein n=1 Tax=Pyrus ussuriensis x Pyrus communis TaxID=2448454 RepID=A0A5N5HF14_9ROSA|nr:pentatricopeptide repeat-containing protein [Pyrus ussuriensis x Pyrus communis]